MSDPDPATTAAPDAAHDESWHQGFASGYKLGERRGRDAERQRIRQLAIECKAIYVTWAPLVPPAVADFADLLDGDGDA